MSQLVKIVKKYVAFLNLEYFKFYLKKKNYPVLLQPTVLWLSMLPEQEQQPQLK